jgi:hypothetical protein
MKYVVAAAVLMTLGMFSTPAFAIRCANGVYRAGCVGPNGAGYVNKYNSPKYHTQRVKCADGVYRTACAGPNGAAVVRRPY